MDREVPIRGARNQKENGSSRSPLVAMLIKDCSHAVYSSTVSGRTTEETHLHRMGVSTHKVVDYINATHQLNLRHLQADSA